MIALSCFFETFAGGGGGGWVVGKSDFNENPVVSLDLDLDFGLRLRVCQKPEDKNLPKQNPLKVNKLEKQKMKTSKT